jgi:AraC-like DNA-binding protein
MKKAMHDSHISGQKVLNEVLGDDAELSPDSMKFTQFFSPAALAPYVTHVFFFRCEELRLTDKMPATLGQLLFLLKGSANLQFQGGHTAPAKGATVLGPGLGAAEFTFNGPFYNLGFALSPLGFVALTGQPANHYADRVVSASELFGPEIDTLAQNITAGFADGTMPLSQIVDEVTRFLLTRLRPIPYSHVQMIQTVIRWVSSDFYPDVQQLYNKLNMSRSTAARLITRYFGCAPKLLMRKYRALRAATVMVDPNATAEMRSQFESTFYDQPHMIREIRQFAGRTPGALDSNNAKVMRLWLSKENCRDIKSFLG